MQKFVLKSTHTPAGDQPKAIEALVAGLKISYEGKSVPVTISCGVAVYSPDQKNMDALISEADKRLYLSKEGGRNRVTGPTPPS